MLFDVLPTEILTQVFLSLPDVKSAIALSATSQRFNSIYHSSKKLVILSDAAESEFGPVDDIVQLVTHNSSQPAHIHRQVPLSEALIKQIVHVGRTAQRWEHIFPAKKWKTDYANRRLLSTRERYVVRRAIYRLWLFSKAFHNSANVRTCRGIPEVVRERTALLHNFSTAELTEMLDIHQVLRDVMANNICPSNGNMRQKFQKRYPDSNPHQLLFNIHLNYPPAPSSFIPESWFHNSPTANGRWHQQPSRWLDPGAEGWGDDITHYYVVEDMMKLNPEQILHLRDQCSFKVQVESYLKETAGEWFINNGETFSETLAFVLKQRGGDMEDLRAVIEDREAGVVLNDE